MFTGFEKNLGLSSPVSYRREALKTIIEEQQQTSSKIKLRCSSYEKVGEKEEHIYRVNVGVFPSLQWTWEGATAFRLRESPQQHSAPEGSQYLWHGKVVEIDAGKGDLYVDLGGQEPTIGEFFVQPYDFLAVMREIFSSRSYEPVWPDLEQAHLSVGL